MQAGIDFTARCMAAEALANGGSGGTSDYTRLTNKPSINNVELSGNKTSANLGLQAEITGNVTISSDNVDDTGATNLFVTTSEKSTWNGKQDALTFDGIYDASTNKAATESTVYNEAANATLASGYTADSSETSITSATNINDAVEQLDYRTTINKTNILLLEEMNGAKNYVPLNFNATSSNYTIAYTNNKLVINGTNTSSSSVYSTVYLPAGEYWISGCPSGAGDNTFYCDVRNNSGGGLGVVDGGNGAAFTIETAGYYRYNVRIAANYTASNLTIEPMFITKSAKDAGFTDYQPYAMSNVELTENTDIVDITNKVSMNTGYTIDSSYSKLYKQGKHIFGTLVLKKSTGVYNSTGDDVAVISDYPPVSTTITAIGLTNTVNQMQNIGWVYISSASENPSGNISIRDGVGTINNCAMIQIDYVTA